MLQKKNDNRMISVNTDTILYGDIYKRLKMGFNSSIPVNYPSGLSVKISNFAFTSGFKNLTSGDDDFQDSSALFKALLKFYLGHCSFSDKYIFKMLEVSDDEVEENTRFTFPVFQPLDRSANDSVLILLHGLNERSWDKYLPWAYKLLQETGKTVILFPSAFHMNRAPKTWADPRLMNEISKERKKLLPSLRESSFANVAISTRLQFVPSRFIRTGLQTVFDIISVVKRIREGKFEGIDKDASIDLFGYSIGAFIAQILMMSNHNKLFSESKLAMFCGGVTFDLMTPVSRAIIDSDGFETIRQYYLNDFHKHLQSDYNIRNIPLKNSVEFDCFCAMLKSGFHNYRDSLFDSMHDKMLAISLKNDLVMRPEAVEETLKTGSRKIEHKTLHFPHRYSHEAPFPINENIREQVSESFNSVFDIFAAFLR